MLSERSVTPTVLAKAVVFASQNDDAALRNLIIPLIAHESFLVRVEALKAMQRAELFRSEEGVKAVEDALQDDEYLVRGFAAKILALAPRSGSLQKLQARRELESVEVVRKILDDSIAKVSKAKILGRP